MIRKTVLGAGALALGLSLTAAASAQPPATGSNVIRGSGNGVGNTIVVEGNGTGKTVISNSRNGVGNRIVVRNDGGTVVIDDDLLREDLAGVPGVAVLPRKCKPTLTNVVATGDGGFVAWDPKTGSVLVWTPTGCFELPPIKPIPKLPDEK
jgi:hypothetical protein